MIAYLDTNVVMRLMQGGRKQISQDARDLMARSDLLISPMATLELEFLYELNRTRLRWAEVLAKLQHEIGLTVCTLPFERVTQMALHESWTRDPFDRIIVAHAKANGLAHLISTDETIAAHYPRTVW